MHIAVLDDNLVDRNQMNRLLTRVSDERKKTGLEGFFIDLYGNYSALIHNVAIYDAIFIDVVNEELKGHEIASEIFFQSVHAKLVLMNSEIIYNDIIDANNRDNYLYINKPIRINELKTVLNMCEEARLHRKPKLELRSDIETLYVKPEEFICATVKEPSKITVTLSFNKEITFRSEISAFKRDTDIFPDIVLVNKHTLVNITHIKNLGLTSLTMNNGETFRISPLKYNQLKVKLNKS